MGDFSAGSFDHCEPSRVKPVFISAASLAILSCSADVVQLQHSSDTDVTVKEQRRGDRSSSLKAGVSVFRALGSVFLQISLSLQSLFMCLLWAVGAIKSQLEKTPHFHQFSQ